MFGVDKYHMIIMYFLMSVICFLSYCHIFIIILPFVHTFCLRTHKLKQVTQLEQFYLKNQALKVHERKLRQQLQQKKEMPKTEYEV